VASTARSIRVRSDGFMRMYNASDFFSSGGSLLFAILLSPSLAEEEVGQRLGPFQLRCVLPSLLHILDPIVKSSTEQKGIISRVHSRCCHSGGSCGARASRSEEHTSELQSR